VKISFDRIAFAAIDDLKTLSLWEINFIVFFATANLAQQFGTFEKNQLMTRNAGPPMLQSLHCSGMQATVACPCSICQA
jgi:hypothetical protein